ncbi:MAG: CHAT domain-containing protein [Anaerolineae bacterium]|nr:CHAT domain-containing protein [Anaerolineae bacterium]
MTLFVSPNKTEKLYRRLPANIRTPEAFVSSLLAQSSSKQYPYLAQYLSKFSQTEQTELSVLLKQQADQFMRTDLDQCLQVAALIRWMGELTGNDLYRALSLRAEGNAYTIGRGEYQRGIDCYDEAAAIYGRFDSKLEQAWSQNGKIYALANLGRYDEALAVGKWAGEIFRGLQEWLPLAELTVNLAIIRGRLSQDAQALDLLDQARDLYEVSGKDVTARLRVVDNNRVILLRNLGRYEESIAVNQAALTAYTLQGNIVDAARAKQNLAITYFVLGRYNEALSLLDQAQEGFKQDGRYRHAMLVELFTSDCLLQLRRFSTALEKCQRARQLFAQLGTPYEIGKCILNEAHAYSGLTQYEDALSSLMEARALFEKEGNRTALADTDLQIGQVLLQQDQPEAALVLAQMAEVIFQQHNFSLGQARACLLAARCSLHFGRLEQTATYIANLLDIATRHNFPTLIYQGHHLQGTLALQQGHKNDALVAWHTGIEALEQVCSRLMLEYRADFTQDKTELYEDIVALYVAQDQAAEALQFAERAKSRALQDMLAYRLDLRIEAHSPTDQPLVDQIIAYRNERDRLYRRWHTGEEPGQRDDPEAQLAAQQAIGERVVELEGEITAVWHKLLVRNAAYAQNADLWQTRTEPIQPYLAPDTALLEFFTVRDRLLVFVVTGDGVEAVTLDTNLKQVQQLLQLFWLNLRTFRAVPHSSPTRTEALTHNAQGVLQKLYQGVLAPLRPQLDAYQKLIIVPHGALHYLPFHALFDGTDYLLQHVEVSYLPAASVLRYSQANRDVDGGLLAVGYSGNGQIPQAVGEAQTIAETWSGYTLLEGEATVGNLKEQAAHYKILHLATHGEFRPDNPLFSGLALADGWLTTLDIFNLRLQASLVTLSACQTGRSLVGGGDELLGLMRAFLAAGARSLVATFWAVEDRTTAVLMAAFYQALAENATKGSALRQAQLQHIDQHPYFWAPFFLVGDTGLL